MQKGVKPRFEAFFRLKSDLCIKKTEEKIRKVKVKMVHWEPTEEEPKGKAKVGKSLKNGTLFDSMRERGESEADVSVARLLKVRRVEKKRKKEFA